MADTQKRTKKSRPKLDPEAQVRMQMAGSWLKGIRQKRGLTQQQLSVALHLKRLQNVSHIEAGYVRLPPDLFRPWSEAMGLQDRRVAMLLISFYTPDLFAILFDEAPPDPDRDFPVEPIVSET